MSKQHYDSDKNVETQPSRIKKKQQKVLAISLILLSILGWSFYSLLSNHAQSHRTVERLSSQRMTLDNPTTHVDGSEVFIEKTQNELSQTQKTTSALQHQLEILTEQKEEQEKTNQSNNESMQAFQVQLKALEEKLNLANPASPGKAYGQNAYPTSPNLDHQADMVSIQPLKGVNDDVLALSPLKNQSVMIPQIKPSKTPDSFVPAGTLQSLGKTPVSQGVTYLAEGPETALSVYQALGGTDVRITLGKSNFKNIDPAKTHQNIVLCLDNDGQSPQSDRLIRFAAEQLQQQGKTVWMAQPNIEGQDYNDILKQQGQQAVKTELNQAIPYDDYRDQKILGRTLQKTLQQHCEVTRQENSLEKLLRESDILSKVYPEIDSKSHQQDIVTAREKNPVPSTLTQQQKPSLKLEKEPELEI